MTRPNLMDDPKRAWAAFEPSEREPWDLDRVAHLHRRAGFSAPWNVLERDAKAGPEAGITRLLEGEPTSLDGQPADAFETQADILALRLGASNNLTRLQAVWVHRMILTPHPLRERLTLFWHDHFATSNAKVQNTNLMRKQNALIRRHALGDFKAMLAEMARDPAMLIWLDSTTNRKAHPNENLAREIMELFALGRGHYSEKDIQEAARAFTGFFVQGTEFRELAAQHDGGEKTILGRTGRFDGGDIAPILLAQPACAEFLATKLFQQFVSETDEPSADLIAPLADALRQSDYDIKTAVGMILRSRLFFDPSVRRRRVKSPVELAIGTVRALEIINPTVSSDALAEAAGQMGQTLYEPPSVAGWDWGAPWINTTTALARTNFILGVLGSDNDRLGNRFDAQKLLERHGSKSAPEFYTRLLVQDALDSTRISRLKGTPRDVAAMILTAPEYQLA